MAPRFLPVFTTTASAAVAVAFCAAAAAAGAQPETGAVLITQAEARTHLTAAPRTPYPAVAAAARVEGSVHLDVEISTDGSVASARLLSGGPMLQRAAIDGVLRWRFAPFTHDGRAVPVRSALTVLFVRTAPSQEDQPLLLSFSDALLRCTDAARRHETDLAVRHCGEARTIARQMAPPFSDDAITPARLQADALVDIGLAGEARPIFERVIEDLRPVKVFSLDRALALRGLARVTALLDDQTDALGYYEEAERQLNDASRRAVENSSYRDELAGYLREMLPEYAALLETSGRSRDAARIRSRLNGLQERR